jgi:hypothetical protein
MHADLLNSAIMGFAAITRDWIDAWNSRDLDRIMAHYCDDVELVSPIVIQLTGRSDATVRGMAMLRECFARGWKAYPALRFDFIRLYPGVRSCVVEYRSINGLISAELTGFDAKGKIPRVLAHYALPEHDANA